MEKYSKKLLWFCIALYVIVFSAICFWKYSNFMYGGLDLAIINNVFWNIAHGNGFWSSIQGHSYLGDHFTPILFLILPIYYLWQSPEILLILQSLFLGLAAWPIYKISEIKLGKNLAFWIALLWLINPLVHNINLYEFHFVSFLPFFFLMAFYFYLKKTSLPFFIFIFLSLLIREDISFIVLALAVIILISNLKNKFLIFNSCSLIFITAGWLIISSRIIAHFSPSNFSPFFYYYSWLGNASLGQVLKHLATYTNLEMIIGFFLPFLFIPLLKPKWLLLAIIPLGQIVFSAAGGGAQVWQMHYAALFLPALVIAFIYSYQQADNFVIKRLNSKYLLIFILIISNVYLWPSFGIYNFKQIKIAPDLKTIGADSSVLASLNYLPNLSSRENIYSLHYYFLGVQQFAQDKYILGDRPEYIVLDKDDYQYYDDILKSSAWAGIHYLNGYQRLDELFAGYQVIKEKDQVSLLKKAAQR